MEEFFMQLSGDNYTSVQAAIVGYLKQLLAVNICTAKYASLQNKHYQFKYSQFRHGRGTYKLHCW